MIYNDLQSYPVFYRDNEFLFTNMECAQQFMAAITKQKRDSIRHITLHLNPRLTHSFSFSSFALQKLLNPRTERTEHRHAAALFYQCADLRSLKCVVTLTESLYYGDLERFLKLVVKEIERARLQTPTLWNLPALSMSVHHPDTRTNIDLGNVTQDSLSTVLNPGHFRLLSHNFMRARHALRRQKVILANHFNQQMTGQDREDFNPRAARGQMMKDLLPSSFLRNAINDTRIHFVGEDRASQDKINSSVGAPSSRTRQQIARSRTVGRLGVIAPRPRARYDVEGRLDPGLRVKEIRLHNAKFQCRLEHVRDAPGTGTWVELESLFTQQGLSELKKHYRHLLEFTGDRRSTTHVQHVKEIPTPKQILDLADSWLSTPIEQPQLWAAEVLQWKDLHKRYGEYIAGVEQD